MLAAAVAFVALNVIAFVQARGMTHFAPAGTRTKPAELLTFGEKCGVLLSGVTLPKPVNEKTPSDLGLPFETITINSTDKITLEAWLISRPDSKGLVLLFHGYGASKASLLTVAKAFHGLGYETMLVDFRGSGGSSGQETSIGFYEADDVAATFVYAKKLKPARPVILYGASMGASAVLRSIHAQNIQPDALILECPFDRLLSTVQMRFNAMKLPSFPLAQLLVFWGGVQQGFNGFHHNPSDFARSVRCPVLLMHGDSDARVSAEQIEHIRKNLPSSTTFKMFPGLDHQSYLATQPEEWNKTVAEFLKVYVLPAHR